MDGQSVLNNLTRELYNHMFDILDPKSIALRLLNCEFDEAGEYCFSDNSGHMVSVVYIYKLLSMRHGIVDFKKIMTKTQTEIEINNVALTYSSNDFFIEVDCAPWSLIERKAIPGLVSKLTQLRAVNQQKHLIILRNVDVLSDSQLHGLRAVMNDSCLYAQFICTMTNVSYVRSRFPSRFYVRLKLNKAKFLDIWIAQVHPLGICVECNKKQELIQGLLECVSGNLIMACMMVISGCHEHEDPVRGYIHDRVIEILAETYTHKAYALIADLVNVLLSSNIPYKVLLNTVIDMNQNTETVKLAAECDTKIASSNKPHFVLEEFLTNIHISKR